MIGPASFTLSAIEEAAKILDYFNGFHDGFIQRMLVESKDTISEDLSQTCTGLFDVEIDIAHYNYPAGPNPFHPHNQVIRATFHNVQDLVCDLSQGFLGNTIIALYFSSMNRRKGGETAIEPCFSLRLSRHYYLENERRHELRESQLFTFADAVFVERTGLDS